MIFFKPFLRLTDGICYELCGYFGTKSKLIGQVEVEL